MKNLEVLDLYEFWFKRKDKLLSIMKLKLCFKNEIEILFHEKLNKSYSIIIENIVDKNNREVYLHNQQHIRNQVLETEKEIKTRIANGENAEKTEDMMRLCCIINQPAKC